MPSKPSADSEKAKKSPAKKKASVPKKQVGISTPRDLAELVEDIHERHNITKTHITLEAIKLRFQQLAAERAQVFQRAAEAIEEELAEPPAKPRIPKAHALINYPGKRLPSDMWTKEEQESVLFAAEEEAPGWGEPETP